MMHTTHFFRNTALLLMALSLVALGACGPKERKARGRMDTPGHHTTRGHDFLEEGNWAEAERSFQLALSLDKKFSPAHAGMAVAKATAAADDRIRGSKEEKKAEAAEDHLKEAFSTAKSEPHEFEANMAGIRVMRLLKKDDDWLKDAEEYYEEAMDGKKKGRNPAPHLYIARAYRDAFDLNKAIAKYRLVLEFDTALRKTADEEMAVVQKIQRAAPGSRYGKIIAFAPSITRADIAGLFIEEMRLDKIFSRGEQTNVNTAFRAPGSAAPGDKPKGSNATDVQSHPLRADILEVVRIGIRGLEVDPSNKYYPDKNVTRAEFAVMVEDILVKVTGEESLRTKFIGQNSPFRDIRGDAFYFNAVQTVTSRGLMEAENKVSGIFGAANPISGADALLVIRMMKDELRSFLR